MGQALLGCIADDFTGATDLANNLVRAGMRVIQTVGVPQGPLPESVDAVVVSLKSRTVEPAAAVEASLNALRWLQTLSVNQVYFKYCSTFDSTAQGNIGPVIDALMQALEVDFTVATPAFPDAGRTVYRGYLFVGDVLLNESGMQDHPLTPMHDANLLRVLKPQTRHSVGLVDDRAVARLESIQSRFDELRALGIGIAVLDAISNDDLYRLGAAVKGLPLVTAGSGLAIGLPANFGIAPNPQAARLPKATGLRAIIAGSCSRATQAQVAHFIAHGGVALRLDPLAVLKSPDGLAKLRAQAVEAVVARPVLVYSTASRDSLNAVQSELGVTRAGQQVESWLAEMAQTLLRAGVRQLVVAGGETSGAVVQALGIAQLRIGEQIDTGVPWCHAYSGWIDETLHLALKSGNFGSEAFFTKAFDVLGQ